MPPGTKKVELPRRVGVGLIGCGRIARLVHLGVLAQMPDVVVRAVAERDSGRRAEAATVVPDAVCLDDYHALLERDDVEAVVVCLPPMLHAAAAIDAFRAGKHVYLEKPIALTLADAEGVCHAWRGSARIGMIGFNFRFNDLYRAMRQALRAGAIGDLVAARSVFSAAARPVPDWKRSRATGGGALLDLGSHHADITRFLLGEDVVAARASVRSQRSEHDSAVLEMHTASGVIVSSFLSMKAIEEHRFEIYGARGRLAMDRLDVAPTLVRPSMPYDRIRRAWDAMAALRPRRLLKGAAEPSFAASLEAFVRGIREGRPPRPDLEDGLRSLAIIEAAERSLHTGRLADVGTVGLVTR